MSTAVDWSLRHNFDDCTRYHESVTQWVHPFDLVLEVSEMKIQEIKIQSFCPFKVQASRGDCKILHDQWPAEIQGLCLPLLAKKYRVLANKSNSSYVNSMSNPSNETRFSEP